MPGLVWIRCKKQKQKISIWSDYYASLKLILLYCQFELPPYIDYSLDYKVVDCGMDHMKLQDVLLITCIAYTTAGYTSGECHKKFTECVNPCIGGNPELIVHNEIKHLCGKLHKVCVYHDAQCHEPLGTKPTAKPNPFTSEGNIGTTPS